VLRRGSVGREFAQILSEAAAQIEEVFIAGLEALKNRWIVWRVADRQIEKAELANTWIWPDFPCLISLNI
jgi:hypothetical protein